MDAEQPAPGFTPAPDTLVIGVAGSPVTGSPIPPHRIGTPRRATLAIEIAGVVATATLLGYIGFFAMFSKFEAYDDEGYWLISLRSFHLHGSLYHHTYSQCGPFFYEFWSAFYSLTGLPICPNTARAASLGAWILASTAIGISTWILTRRYLLGLLVQVATWILLFTLISEPLEPAGLAYVLVGGVMIGIALVARGARRVGMLTIGTLATALVMTKVNIGLLVLAALVFAGLVCWPSERLRRARLVVGSLEVLAVGVVLTAQIIDQDWVFEYVIFVVACLAAMLAFVVTRNCSDERLTTNSLLWAGGPAGITAVVICLGVIMNGTSPRQLIDGTILSQRGLAGIFHIRLPIHPVEVVFALLIASIGIAVALFSRRDALARLVHSRLGGLARLAVGAWMIITVQPLYFLKYALGSAHPIPYVHGISFLLAAPFIWVALIETSRDSEKAPSISLPRVALAAIAALGCYEAFPAAGSQLWWASIALMPIAALCLLDGITVIAHATNSKQSRLRSTQRMGTAFIGILVAALLAGPVFALGPLRARYNETPALQAAGAHWIHLDPTQAHTFDRISATLKNRCTTFQGLPGLNTFYFLTGLEPPTDLNTTQWMNLLSDAQQNEVLNRLKVTKGLCVVKNTTLIPFWSSKGSLRRSPLVRYLERDFVVIKTEGPYRVLARPTTP